MEKGTLSRPFSVIRRGFEPLTVCLEGRCSIQLSYRTVLPPTRAVPGVGDCKVSVFFAYVQECQSPRPWQFLNFLPLPQGQGSFLPTLGCAFAGMGFCRSAWLEAIAARFSASPGSSAFVSR